MADAAPEPLLQWAPRKGADYVIWVQPDVEYQFHFLDDGSVVLDTAGAHLNTQNNVRTFRYIDGHWQMERSHHG